MNKTVICVYIPESEPSEKPVFMKKQGMEKGTYIRVGSTDQVCNSKELAKFIQRKHDRPYDETIIPETSLLDINTLALDSYRNLRRMKYQRCKFYLN